MRRTSRPDCHRTPRTRACRRTGFKTHFSAVLLHCSEHSALIGFEHDQIIGAVFKNFIGDLPLTAHGVEGDDTVI